MQKEKDGLDQRLSKYGLWANSGSLLSIKIYWNTALKNGLYIVYGPRTGGVE